VWYGRKESSAKRTIYSLLPGLSGNTFEAKLGENTSQYCR
jgi:hypothetical protein